MSIKSELEGKHKANHRVAKCCQTCEFMEPYFASSGTAKHGKCLRDEIETHVLVVCDRYAEKARKNPYALSTLRKREERALRGA